MDLGLQGKVAMVAGASRGLGFAVARLLAQEGATVSIASRSAGIADAAAQIQRETGARVHGHSTDVASAAALEAWHAATIAACGGVDLLFSNSGGPPPGGFDQLSDAAWQSSFELLVLSAIRLARLVAPGMQARGGGAILLSTSTSVQEPIPNLALSNVLRAAVGALAKTLANEFAPRGIRVNQLMPGRIATDRLRQLDEATGQRLGISAEEAGRRAAAAIPLARYGQPEEFARAAVFLLSPAASYITGATLQVDGGALRRA